MKIKTKQVLTTFYAILFLLTSVIGFSQPVNATGCAAPAADKGTASSSFAVASAGAYRLWAHVNTPSLGNRTFDVSIDGNCPVTVSGSEPKTGTFDWLGATPLMVNLTAGVHKISISGQDRNISVDEILLSTNSSCVPAGNGSNCASTTVNTSGAGTLGVKSVIQTVALVTIVLFVVVLVAFWFYAPTKSKSLFGRMLRGVRPKVYKTSNSWLNFLIQPSRKSLVLLGTSLCIVVASLVLIASSDTKNSVVVNLMNSKVTGQAKIVPNDTAITGYLVQFSQGGSSTTSQPTQVGTAPSASPSITSPVSGSNTSPKLSSNPAPAVAGTVTPASDITCNYQEDTWSGDATSVGYNVTKLSASDGNPASFSVKLNANPSNTAVVGYPSDQCLLYSALPANLVSSYSTTPPAASAGLDYEFAYDIWLTTTAAASSNNWENDLELMIWTYTNGQVPAGSLKSTLPDGSQVWIDGDNKTGIVSVVLPNSTNGTVNISGLISQLKALGYVAANYDGILDLEYGVEAPYGGGQTFTVNSLVVGK